MIENLSKHMIDPSNIRVITIYDLVTSGKTVMEV